MTDHDQAMIAPIVDQGTSVVVDSVLENEMFDALSRLGTEIGTERGGFEPPRPVSQSNGLANRSEGTESPPEYKGNPSHQRSLAHHLPTDTCQTDPDLARIVDAWPTLPEAVRAGIVAMVKAAGK